MDISLILPPLTLHFDIVEQIAKGGNSIVYSIKSKDNKLFVCKIYDENIKEMAMEESLMASKISKYPNKSPFLTFYGAYSHDKQQVNVYELFEGRELSILVDCIRKNPTSKPSEQQMIHVARSLLEQVAYLNDIGLCHGDIHSGNILNDGIRFILIDITGQTYNSKYPAYVHAEICQTTVEYWDKSIRLGYTPTSLIWKKDIFNIGEVLIELLGYNSLPNEYLENPDKYRISSEYPSLDFIINSAISVDISKRPFAIDLLKFIETLS